jgi:hypothetical protein
MFSLSCILQSHSHELNENAFKLFMNDASLTQVTKVTKTQLEIAIKTDKKNVGSIEDFYPKAHLIASNFIMAMNIASLGHFTWLTGSQLYPTYQVNPKDKAQAIIFTNQRTYPSENRPITDGEVRQAAVIFGALLREKDQNIRKEYIKGILHMGLSFQDINFDKEAFGNFYRSFEYFITNKFLKMKKLNKELKEFKKAILGLGLSDQFAQEFSDLYKLRSEQVMHAQREQVEITQDDVIKMKVFIDYCLHKYFTKIGNEGLMKNRMANHRLNPTVKSPAG